MDLEKISWTQRSTAGKCSECGGKIGTDENCYRKKDELENPQFVGNNSDLVCIDCA